MTTWIGESFFQGDNRLFWCNSAQNIQHNLRLDAYRHLQSLELADFDKGRTGGLMSILSDDVNQLKHDIIQVTTTIVVIHGAFFVWATLVVGMTTLLPK
ncbi:ABC transporter transmembrane domain-containing protein [Nostoc sp. CENA543]|uniref:ABC transporter transmembrane domain-containing protein n=1 Tax=Nostoc sp. CENA543 TaxID=1869241 RepID=UPI001CEF7BE6|nr:ABC transporter transmembrane domain-containing protein [Nostoc sp. CENA543]